MKMTIWTDIGQIKIRLLPEKAPTSISILKKAPSRVVPVYLFGKEIYFSLADSVYNEAFDKLDELEKENPQKIFEVGDVAFWKGRNDIPFTDPLHHGACLCIFFGVTPVSNKPEALEPINLIGKVYNMFELLERISMNNVIQIEKIE